MFYNNLLWKIDPASISWTLCVHCVSCGCGKALQGRATVTVHHCMRSQGGFGLFQATASGAQFSNQGAFGTKWSTAARGSQGQWNADMTCPKDGVTDVFFGNLVPKIEPKKRDNWECYALLVQKKRFLIFGSHSHLVNFNRLRRCERSCLPQCLWLTTFAPCNLRRLATCFCSSFVVRYHRFRLYLYAMSRLPKTHSCRHRCIDFYILRLAPK